MTSTKSPTIYNCTEELFNSLYFICENTVYLNEVVSPKLIYILNELSPFELKFIYFKEDFVCHICGRKLNKNGTKKYNLVHVEFFIIQNRFLLWGFNFFYLSQNLTKNDSHNICLLFLLIPIFLSKFHICLIEYMYF